MYIYVENRINVQNTACTVHMAGLARKCFLFLLLFFFLVSVGFMPSPATEDPRVSPISEFSGNAKDADIYPGFSENYYETVFFFFSNRKKKNLLSERLH